nr:hypothetical protein Itr_chr14CG31470 [Ipomoea trifida]
MNNASGNLKQLGPLVRIPNLIHAYYAGEGSVRSGPANLRKCTIFSCPCTVTPDSAHQSSQMGWTTILDGPKPNIGSPNQSRD